MNTPHIQAHTLTFPKALVTLLAGALFTAIVATLGAHFVWENGAHYSIFQWLGQSVDGIPEGPTTPINHPVPIGPPIEPRP